MTIKLKKPRAVLISDLHFNLNNLKVADEALKLANNKALELSVPLIIAGDLNDTKALLRGECVNTLLKTLKVSSVRKIVIPGNHDLLNEKSKEHSLNFLKDCCEVISEVTHDNVGQEPTGLWFVPYISNKEEAEKTFSMIPEGSTVIAHQGVHSAWMGHYVQDNSSVAKEVFGHLRVLSGHYHRAQDIRCVRPKKNGIGLFTYIGSPYTTSFAESEDGPKGFRVLYDDGSAEIVPTNLRNHIVKEIYYDQVEHTKLAFCGPDDLVWLKIKGPYSQLEKLNKTYVGNMLIGHNNFKLEKILTDSKIIEQSGKKLTGQELFDKIIDATTEPLEQKIYLKTLWREIV